MEVGNKWLLSELFGGEKKSKGTEIVWKDAQNDWWLWLEVVCNYNRRGRKTKTKVGRWDKEFYLGKGISLRVNQLPGGAVPCEKFWYLANLCLYEGKNWCKMVSWRRAVHVAFLFKGHSHLNTPEQYNCFRKSTTTLTFRICIWRQPSVMWEIVVGLKIIIIIICNKHYFITF